ncbi:MAG: hypothetical protein KBT36_09480 [Kurthia sp.]|nr:hypothetical protein [Candidatus Kurthia equi]
MSSTKQFHELYNAIGKLNCGLFLTPTEIAALLATLKSAENVAYPSPEELGFYYDGLAELERLNREDFPDICAALDKSLASFEDKFLSK